MSITDLKQALQTLSTIPTAQQRLIFKGKVLRDDKDIQFYNIEEGNTLHLAERPPDQQQNPQQPAGGAQGQTQQQQQQQQSPQVGRIPGIPGDVNITIQNVLRGLTGANRVVVGGAPQNPESMHQNIRTIFNSVANPQQQQQPGQAAPAPAPAQDNDRPTSERMAESLRSARTTLQWLTENTDAAITALDNERNLDDQQQRQQLQQQIRDLQAAYQRTSMASSSMAHYLSGFHAGSVPGEATFTPPQPTAQISQIHVQIDPQGQAPGQPFPGAPFANVQFPAGQPFPGQVFPGQPNPAQAFPNVFANLQQQAQQAQQQQAQGQQPQPGQPGALPFDFNNLLQNVMGSLMGQQGQQAQGQQPQGQQGQPQQAQQQQQQAQGQQPGLPFDLNGLIQNVMGSMFGGGVQPGQQPGQPQQPGQANPAQPFMDMMAQLLNPQAAADQNNAAANNNNANGNSFTSQLPLLFMDMQMIFSDVPAQNVQGHTNIRRVLMNDFGTSSQGYDAVIDDFIESVRPYFTTLHNIPLEVRNRIVPNSNLDQVVIALIRKYMTQIFKIVMSEPSESNPIKQLTSEWSTASINEMVTEIANRSGGVEDAFIIINGFIQDRLSSVNPGLAPFSGVIMRNIRTIYVAQPQTNNNNINNNNNNIPATTPTTTTTTTTTTAPTTTTSTSTTSTTNTSNGVIPQEWVDTIEIDVARQESAPEPRPLSQNYRDPSSNKKQKTSNSSAFAQRLEEAVQPVDNVNGEDLLNKAKEEGLAELYNSLIAKMKDQQQNNQ
ncbi:hypothetical protein SAMD00019534_003890 [Acytostelium subglobosum LB1]|uniref:hypothetical protein n=1 Tax=Acytostelium subglobosum LB1 TaxID=1410327 RepID=UPI0006449F50|nr:hypothetical protein SAMD00019534_003890 [Acytostelium subglobosum LB1]GAM17214.1 hypothetical protein SAMD00019534_003890 [Acytostelium subglobosum LB1]|eukprot:XP_012759276.1 hypothetical protein SAMD00019534_003890 [Acytostelium subglobosum LB1]